MTSRKTAKNLRATRRSGEDNTQAKIDTLATWICDAAVVVWFTGAGVSTDSGLPDFRGPDGVWTRAEKGLPPPEFDKSIDEVEPNAAHLAIVAFERIGKCDFLISQNVDNLHLKSGFPLEKLAELHGNEGRLRCQKCGATHALKDFRTDSGQRKRSKGRFLPDVCPDCDGRMKRSVVNFGDPMPDRDLSAAFDWARRADLMIVVGSSCQVTPAADVPRVTKRRGGRLVILNIGKTPLDEICDLGVTTERAGVLLPGILAKVQASSNNASVC